MRTLRVVMCLFVVLILTSCGKSGAPKPGTADSERPVPPVVLTELPVQVSSPVEQEAPAIQDTQDIPQFNNYNVSITFEPETRTFKGIENVEYTNRAERPMNELIFRLYLNAFSADETFKPYTADQFPRIFLGDMDYGYMNIEHVTRDNEELSFVLNSTVLTVYLDEPLQPRETIQVSLVFEAYVPKIAHRTGANDKAVWCGTFLPTVAVYGNDGFDTAPYYPVGDSYFAETANYNVDIIAPNGYVVAGTGIKTESVEENRTITNLTARMTRDFAFAISNEYKLATLTVTSGVELRFYYYTESLPVNEILGVAAVSMTIFENAVGVYPYDQLCIVETDNFMNGMEFSKIVFVDSSYLQVSPTLTSITHEIGHQWFFNVVGSNPVTEAWMDEGFTSFVQDGLLSQPAELRKRLENDYAILETRFTGIRDTAKRRMSSDISVYTVWSDYHTVQYLKAKVMLYGLYLKMGEENFRALLREYYRRFSFGIATSKEFIELAESIHGSSLKSFFDEWLYGVGLPPFPR